MGEIAGRTHRREAGAVVSADRDNGIVGQPRTLSGLPAGEAPALQIIVEALLRALFEDSGRLACWRLRKLSRVANFSRR